MGFAIQTHNMNNIRNYKEADNYFNTTPQPRSKRWESDERPLRDVRSTHLRMVTGFEKGLRYYDLFLYQTPLVRYYQPNERGEEAVWLQYFYSQSSNKFLWAHHWWDGKQMTCDDGTEFRLPIASRTQLANALWGDDFTVKLVLDQAGKVIKSKSAHMPTFRFSSTSTMRARRKAMREKIEMMLTVVEMQYGNIVGDLDYDIWAGSSFKSVRSYTSKTTDITRSFIRLEQWQDYPDAISISDAERTAMFEFAQQAAREYLANAINQRLYKLETVQDGWYKRPRGNIPEHGMVRDLPPDLYAKAIPTQDEVRKAVTQRIVGMAALHADSLKPDDQFPAKLSRSRPTPYTRDEMDNLPNLLGADLYLKLVNRKGIVY